MRQLGTAKTFLFPYLSVTGAGCVIASRLYARALVLIWG